MKIAISGKGGVGKTLLTSMLAVRFALSGRSTIAIDADPDSNLASTLGILDASSITPISEMKELINERTSADSSGSFYKLNPKVDDLPEKYSAVKDGVKVMVMGRVKRGGSGCYCPENALLSSLLSHLLIGREDTVLLDMAAGIEHLSRGTAASVDMLIIIVEPGRASIESAKRIEKLADDLGIKNIFFIGNKINNPEEEEYLISSLPKIEFLGFVPYSRLLIDADTGGKPILNSDKALNSAVSSIFAKIIATN